MVNLKEKPFFLDDRKIEWVEETIRSMTPEERRDPSLLNSSQGRLPLRGQGHQPDPGPEP